MKDDFGVRLIRWYADHKRDLPWRKSGSAYHVWLSEVILQQTRVAQGLDYYFRFIEKYPDIHSLAEAGEDEVFKLWQGLGYYNRAANLMHAARTIVDEYDGEFPATSEELQKIKGIGPYTAAAIASIVHGEAVPVLDGNVFRVLSRVFGMKTPIDTANGRSSFRELARELMAHFGPGEFNQALMEFGALHCKPKNPDCSTCIFADRCMANQHKTVDQLPVKKGKPKQKNRFFYYFFIEVRDDVRSQFYLRRRTAKDIWKNLYDFPADEFDEALPPEDLLKKSATLQAIGQDHFSIQYISPVYIHQLTHQRIHATFLRLIVNKKINHPFFNSLPLVTQREIVEYPVPRLIDRYLREQKIIGTDDRT
ncbi:MAG: A/G-specific adenine glycosylase [bacterium]